MAQANTNLPHDITEMQTEALDNARNGQSFTNYPAILQGFTPKGIPESDIKPRENVFTFNAWKALGRSVKKGEHGVKVVTFVPIKSEDTGEVVGRTPHTTTVFHVSQTELTSDAQARWASQPRRPRSQWASGHGRYPSIDPGYVDPGELAADRWNETHG
jgi:hypothetical protein